MKNILTNKPEIENIIFDFGNVILDIDIQKSIDAFMALNIEGLKPENIFPSPLAIFEEYERGLITTHEFYESFKKEYKAHHISEEQFFNAWNALLLHFDPKRIAKLQELAKSYNLYLLSNTNAKHVEVFNADFKAQFGYEMSSLFTHCYYSNELKTRKPDSDIYEKVLALSHLNPSKTIFIDDLKENTEAAGRSGLHTHHLQLPESILDIL